ncbi:MAG: class I SAM-dependent methyltransferase [Elusimicrobia bacterium]|nr:class I SAM-dependent methyltransferase [Elusimicrobiota bacterium]
MISEINYDKIWSEWGDMSQNAPTPIHTRRLIFKETGRLSFSSAIDVGCGMGVLIQQFQERFPKCRCAGSDIARTALERARKRSPRVVFHELDIQSRALNDSFDLVMCSEVIEHLQEPEAAMRNIRKMCSGYLILTTPTGARLPTDMAFHHLKHFTPEELAKLVEDAGFIVERLYRWGWPFQVLFRHLINLAPGAAHNVFVRGGNYGIMKKAASAVWSALFYLNLTGMGTQLVLVARVR